jgi:hypothetical protein
MNVYNSGYQNFIRLGRIGKTQRDMAIMKLCGTIEEVKFSTCRIGNLSGNKLNSLTYLICLPAG